jgi:hypothetical protein
VTGGIGVVVGIGTTDELPPPPCVAEVELEEVGEIIGLLGEYEPLVRGVMELELVEFEGTRDVGLTECAGDEVGAEVFFVEDGIGTILDEFIVGVLLVVVGRGLWVLG